MAFSFISITLRWDAISDNWLLSSETTSLENDATNPSNTSRNATNEGAIASATPEDIRDYNHRDCEFRNASWTLQSSGFNDRVDDPAREAPLALTRETLQQHNTINISAGGQTMDKSPFHEHHLKTISLGDAAADSSTSDGHNVHEGPYTCPRQRSKHCLSIALANMSHQSLDTDIGLSLSSVAHKNFPAYPTCIDEVDLYDHLPEPKFYDDSSATKPSFSESSAPGKVSCQVLDLQGTVYAGIGTQFSS